jgi:excisionase family DNA binding protein
MSSNIRIKKICLHCKQSFIAQKTVTKFCSLTCAQRNYKKRKREEKITQTILAVNDQSIGHYALAPHDNHITQVADRLSREWINIQDIAELLGVGERTLFRAIKDKAFPKVKVGRRLLFNKQYVLDYFISKSEEI